MAWWTNILTQAWSTASDVLTTMWPIAVVPVAFGIIAFVWSLILATRGD